MTYPIQAGIQISLNYNPSTQTGTWYRLTDHNRSPISLNPELIEKSARMANGKMRKYIISQKKRASASWEKVPSQTTYTVDGNLSSEWLSAFYAANAGVPVWVKIVAAKENVPSIGAVPNEATRVTSLAGADIFQAFITSFTSTVVWRTKDRDFVDMSIEFTEV